VLVCVGMRLTRRVQRAGGGRFTQHKNRHDSAQERSGREIGRGARCAEVPESHNKQRQAHTIAEEADDAGRDCRQQTRQGSPSPQAEQNVNRTRNQALHLHDLRRIGERNLAREVVVEAPEDARTDYRERACDSIVRPSVVRGRGMCEVIGATEDALALVLAQACGVLCPGRFLLGKVFVKERTYLGEVRLALWRVGRDVVLGVRHALKYDEIGRNTGIAQLAMNAHGVAEK
jgi:hypothetical protein